MLKHVIAIVMLWTNKQTNKQMISYVLLTPTDIVGVSSNNNDDDNDDDDDDDNLQYVL